jgi:FixJ family two-component response regulator
MNANVPVVFLVDDDPSILKALCRLLAAEGFETRPYSSATNFLDDFNANLPGCIVMDLAMPGLSGLELQSRLASSGRMRPIVFITGHGDIPSSVRAMKAGAVDFLIKPFDDHALLSAVRVAIEKDRAARFQQAQRDRIEKSLATLTAREREVFQHVTRGRLNKQIAGDLGIVEKTVKVHRGRIMKKMGVRTLAELVKLAERLESFQLTEQVTGKK